MSLADVYSLFSLLVQALQRCAVLGAVVGGDVVEERVRSATETAKRPVDGEEATSTLL